MMKGNSLLANLLVIWTMAVFIDCDVEKTKIKIKVTDISNEINLTCENGKFNREGTDKSKDKMVWTLEYKDEDSGMFTCYNDTDNYKEEIYVKLRTCDNCIELDTASAVGMVLGDLVATVLIGVAVYHIASQHRATLATGKKASSQMVLIQNEANAQADPGTHYQRLNKKRQETSEYSTLQERR